MSFDVKRLMDVFQHDYKRYFPNTCISIDNIFSRIELIGILCYRIAQWFYENGEESLANHVSVSGKLKK